MAECLQRGHFCTPNREGRYFNSTPVQLQLTRITAFRDCLVLNSKLQTDRIGSHVSSDWGWIQWLMNMCLICRWHYRCCTNSSTSNVDAALNSETWFSLNLYAQPGNRAVGVSWCNCTAHMKTGQLDDGSLPCEWTTRLSGVAAVGKRKHFVHRSTFPL